MEGHLIPAHKVVLCQRCGVLADMFTGDYNDSQSEEVRKYSVITINIPLFEYNLAMVVA